MDKDDVDYFAMTIRESLSLMFWTSFATLLAVGAILALAL
jgi:hypothetical protein